MNLKKQLRLHDLVILGWIFIGPAAAMGLYGPLTAITDGAATLVYVLATLLMGFTVYSYAQLAKVIPNSGSVYAYACRSISPRFGFLVGWMVLLDYLFVPAVAYLFTGIALNAIWQEFPVWLGALLAIVITTSLNLMGIRKAMWVTYAVLLVEIVCLLTVLAWGFYLLSNSQTPINWLVPFSGSHGWLNINWPTILTGISIAIMSFLGFDAIATFTEENIGSSKQIGIAMALCLLLAGAFFVAQIYIAALLPQISLTEIKSNTTLQNKAYYDIVKNNMGVEMNAILASVKALGAAFAAMVAQAASARLIFSMGRDKRLPSFLSKTNPKTGTPQLAVLICALLNLILVMMAALHENGLTSLVSCIDVGALIAFITLHISVIGFFIIKPKQYQLKPLCLYGIIPLIGILLFLPVLLHIQMIAKIIATIWLGLGVIVLLCHKNARIPL